MITAMDIGQAHDPAAVVGIARQSEERWLVQIAEEFPRGTPYRVLAAYAGSTTSVGPVVIDATGVGRVVTEQARQVATRPRRVWSVTATAGNTVRHTGRDVTVPKGVLVQAAQTAVERGRLTIPNNHGGRRLAAQLHAMRRDWRGRMAAKPGHHDDLAFALFMAVWLAGHENGGSDVRG